VKHCSLKRSKTGFSPRKATFLDWQGIQKPWLAVMARLHFKLAMSLPSMTSMISMAIPERVR
jgi:hypothetical protein